MEELGKMLTQQDRKVKLSVFMGLLMMPLMTTDDACPASSGADWNLLMTSKKRHSSYTA